MNGLRGLIGEPAMNRALRGLLERSRQTGSVVNLPALAAALAAEAPRAERHLVADWLQDVVVYDLAVESTRARPLGNGRYEERKPHQADALKPALLLAWGNPGKEAARRARAPSGGRYPRGRRLAAPAIAARGGMVPDRIRTLIVDDDADARALVQALLDVEPDFEVIGECADGADAVRQVREHSPELVFLDVQLPRLDGFGVVNAVGARRMPVTVFTTAYAEFALRAFDAFALDYLLKPLEEERFIIALERARDAVRMRRSAADPRMEHLVDFLQSPVQHYPQTIAVKVGDRFRFVDVGEIDYLEADGKHIRLIAQKTPTILHRSLTDMEARVLDPMKFVRIHRSTIVNLSRIDFVEPLFHGELSVALRDGTRLVCSRRFRGRIQERVPFTG